MNFVIQKDYNYNKIQAGNISNIINEKIVAIAYEFLEYKCISTK